MSRSPRNGEGSFTASQERLSNEANLVINQDLAVPAPFAVQIAAVTLSSASNSFNDGYEVDLSASFGQDYVRLSGDEGIEIRAFCGVKQALVQLSFANSYPSHGSHFPIADQVDDDALRIERTRELSKEIDANLTGGMSGKLLVKGKYGEAEGCVGGKKAANTKEKLVESQKSVRKREKVFAPTADQVIIGAQDSEFPLDGVELTGYRGWKVVPKSTEHKSGVVAKLMVRENWISISDVTLDYSGGTINRQLQELFEATSEDAKQRQIFFELMLRKLVFLGLQDHAEKDFGTLAADAFVIEPERDIAFNLDKADRIVKIPLNNNLLSKFLAADAVEAEKIANDPASYLINHVAVYEFPGCHPLDLIRYLGFGDTPLEGAELSSRKFEHLSNASVTKELDFLNISYREEFQRIVAQVPRHAGVSSLIENVSKVPVLKEAVTRYSLARFGTPYPTKSRISFFSFFFRKKRKNGAEEIRAFFRDHLVRVCGSKISMSEIDEKVEFLVVWLSLVLGQKYSVKGVKD